MARLTDIYKARQGRPMFLCDFSPPRGGNMALLEGAREVDADVICVNYCPNKSVRADSAITAYLVRQRTGKEVAFNLATRDMNRLALQSHLLGAQLLGLQNVVVLGGDSFTLKDQPTQVDDWRPTDLIAAISAMNRGLDYRGLRLRVPTDFCIGAGLDLSRDMEQEARLAHRKTQAGAHFFITQPIYDPVAPDTFQRAYRAVSGGAPPPPVFYGVQVLEKGGLALKEPPLLLQQQLQEGRAGVDIALELLHQLAEAHVDSFYIVPPILRGGLRRYEAAQGVLATFKVGASRKG